MCFDQAVFKNSCSEKNMSDIKKKGWQHSINWHGIVIMMLFVLKLFIKSSEKIKYRTNIFWKIFYSAIFLKYWLTTLANMMISKVHDSLKYFNILVATIKRTLWIRASSLSLSLSLSGVSQIFKLCKWLLGCKYSKISTFCQKKVFIYWSLNVF